MDAARTAPLRLPPPLIWVLGSLPVLFLFLSDFRALHDGGIVGLSETWGRDFVNVWTGGKLAIAHRLDILYDLDAYRAFEGHLYGRPAAHNYSYPPLALFLNIPFALMPYGVALAVWIAGTAALFAAAVRPWVPGPARWLLVLTPAATMNIWAGHYGFLIGALFLFGWRLLPDRPRLAGICFGLMALKPHLALLVPLILLLRGEWRAIATAALTTGLLVAASALAFGPDLWRLYLTVTAGVQARMIDPGAEFYGLMATSLASGLLRQGVPAAIAWAAQGLVMAGAVAVVVIATIRRAPPMTLALLSATATFVILPYAFNYDLTVVALAALVMWSRADATPGARAVALIAFIAPQIGMVMTAIGVPLLPIAVVALLWVQAAPWVSRGRAAPAALAAAHSA